MLLQAFCHLRLGNMSGIDEAGPDIMAIYINDALEPDEYFLYQSIWQNLVKGFIEFTGHGRLSNV